MFALRGVGVALASFGSLYCVLSVLTAWGWRWVKLLRGISSRGLANLLFVSRIFPLAASGLITIAFVVPSFLELEPRSGDEDFGVFPLLLGTCALFLFALGLFRVVAAQARTSRVVADWLEGANTLDAGAPAPTFQTCAGIPPLTLVGVCNPRVLVSETTVAVLSHDELQIALKHEMAHMRARDNLKKLIFRFSAFPGMAKLEGAWSEATELAADDAAVSSVREALDLAAALVKLSRLVPVEAAPAFTIGLVDGSGSVRARVARLLAWDETNAQRIRTLRWYAATPLLAAVFFAAATYGPTLALTHRLTEWLVR